MFSLEETLCNRYIFIKFVTRFQISKCLVHNVWTSWFKIYMIPVLKIPFQFNHNPLETSGLGKMLRLFTASTGMLQILPLILEN